ncbi:discoidin domain-containing protein [Cohnella zeiphila]|uniref:Discoidin domain-containing protein n=1 Tax=Cohnella zeiphila TaxID=2761120 RepID=A0A7X0VUZ5_9BACL|nr:discoidin domain-containing protein [Cohnella zeiphila]MBB6730915.1 discoidin domain-containing protein [Cohnella zeiphila]
MVRRLLSCVSTVTLFSTLFLAAAPGGSGTAAADEPDAGHTYYVDAVNGDDGNDGSSDHPWQTIGKAAGVLVAGDTAKIRSGVYRETVKPAHSGAPGSDITFEADDGADVTVSGADLVTGTWTPATEVPTADVYKIGADLHMGDYLDQVYVDGVANNWARTPNTDVGNLYDPNLYEYDNTQSSGNKLVDNANLNQPAGAWDGAAVFYEDAGSWNFGSAFVSTSTPGTLNIATSPAFYSVRLSSLDDKLTLLNQNGSVLGSANVDVQLNTVYHVKIAADDGTIQVYLNDDASPAITANDPNPIEGFFGLGVQSGSSSAAASAEFANVNATITSQSADQALGKATAPFASNLEGWSAGDTNGYWRSDGTELAGYTQPQISQTGTSYNSAVKAKNFTYSANVKLTAAGAASMTFRKQEIPYIVGMGNWGLGNSEYFIMGKLAALDYPGEWYYDRTAHQLYLKTTGSDDPSAHTVEVKARNLAFDLADRSNIVVKGVKLFAATIDTANGENDVIDGIHAKYVSDYYVQPSTATGICLCGKNDTLKNSEIAFSSGSLVSIKGEGNKLINNVIHDGTYGGIVFQSAIDVYGVGHLISNNTVYHAARSLIGGQFYASSIQYNDFYGANGFATDTGLLYTAHSDLGNSEIHHNYWHDYMQRPKSKGSDSSWSAGVYLDNGTYNALVYDNVTWGFPWRGIMVNYASNFVQVYNNTTYNASIAEISKAGYTVDDYKDKVYNNISTDGLDTSGLAIGADYQANLTSGDPGFANPDGLDFHLKTGSPGLDAGIPISGITDPGDGAPDIGAYQSGEPAWKVGADLNNPPAVEPTLQLTQTDGRNLLVNGPFELDRMGQPGMDGLYGWTRTYSQTAQPVVDVPGNKTASRIGTFNGASLGTGEDGIEQTIGNLEPNTKYEVRGFLRSAASGQSVKIGARSFDDAGTDTSKQTSEDTWQEETFTFTTGASSTSATIYAYKPDNGVYAFLDDFSVAKYEEPPAQPPAPAHTEEGTLSVNDTVTGTGTDQFDYTGTWTAETGNAFNYHEDNHQSSAEGDSYEVKFSGVQIQLYSELENDMGIVGVSIDGGDEAMVDTYSSTHIGDALAYTSPRLPDGTHTLKVRLTGTKNPDSSGTKHVADRVVVVSANAPVHIDDSETGTGTAQFNFSDGWTQAANNTDYNDTNHFTQTADASYEVKFDGVQAKLFSEVDTNMGIVGVSVDGGPEMTVDLYSAKHFGDKLVYTTPRMPDGEHTMKVRVTGRQSPLSSGAWAVADRVDVISADTPIVVNDTQTGTGNNQFDYHGTWYAGTDNAACYNSDNHFTNEAGAYYEIRFVGKGIRLYSERNSGDGIIDIYIDGAKAATVDMNSSVHMGDDLVFSSAELTDGPHTLKVVNTAASSPGGGPWSVADRVDIIPTSVPDTDAPSAPANLTAPTVTATTADLAWDASTDNYGVEVYEIFSGTDLIGLTRGTSFTASGLQDGQTYTFTVKAKDAAGNESAAGAPVQVTVHAPLPNLALGKTATESSVYQAGFEGDKAFDGDSATRWAAAEGSSNPQWVSVDLGDTVQIGHVKLSWAVPHGTSYQILVSTDGTDWTEVYATTSGNGGLDDIKFPAVDARYVKLNVLDRSDPYWGATVYEFEVYGDSGAETANQAPAAVNVAIDGTAAVGETLTGAYDYSDPDGDAEGASTFQWYRGTKADGSDKTPIDGATSPSYTVASGDAGTYLFFEVTPVASDGILQGDPVVSPGLLVTGGPAPTLKTVYAEDFEGTDVGAMPEGWTVTGAGSGNAVSVQQDGDGKNLKLVQTYNNDGDGSFKASYSFDPIHDLAVAEERIMAEQGGATGSFLTLYDSQGTKLAELLYDLDYAHNGSRELARRTPDGNWHNLLPYNANQWYDVRLTVDLAAGTYDVAIDGTAVESGIPLLNPADDVAKLETSGWNQSPGTFHLDDLNLSGPDDGTAADSTPPVTSATRSAEPNDAGWNRTGVTVSLQASDEDGGSGVAKLVYDAAGAQSIGERTVDGAAAEVTISAEGETELSFHAVDAAGNEEPAQTLQVRIDSSAPSVTVAGAGTYTIDQTVQITCTAADSASGLASDPCAAPLVNAPAYTLGIGSHTVNVQAADKAGNTTQQSADYQVKITLASLLKLILSWVHGPGANGIVQSFAAKLQMSKLDSFLNEVSAQSGKSITADQAKWLRTLAEAYKRQDG